MAQQAQAPSLNSDPLPATRAYRVPLHAIEQAWIHAEPLLEKSCKEGQGRWTIEGLEYLCNSGEKGLLLIMDDEVRAAVVLSVSFYPGRKALTIIAAGGELTAIRDHKGILDEIARENGCTLIEFGGRKAWKRIFPEYKEAVYLTKELHDA